jgi:phage gpG-like protein
MPEAGFIYITIDGAQIKRKIATFGKQISDLKPAWEKIAEDLRSDVREQFATEGAYIAKSMAWYPLAPATVRDRISKGFMGSHPILYRTGRLMRSFVDPATPGNITYMTGDSLSVGSNYWTAAWHQQGTDSKGSFAVRRMPARPMIGISWKRKSGIVNRIREYVDQILNQNGMA